MPAVSLTPLPRPTTDLATLTDDIDRCGFCILENALTPEQVEGVRTRLDAQARAERERGLERGYPVEAQGESVNQWLYMLSNKGEEFHTLALHPKVGAVVEHVLGEGALLSALDAHITYPGNLEMPLHIDQWWMPQPVMPGARHQRLGNIRRDRTAIGDPTPADGPISPPLVINVMWMVSDFTADNGATRLVPGSHLSGRQPDPARRYDTVVVEGPAGSALAWEGRTWHAAGLNRSNGPRHGVVTYFCAPMIRTLSNFTYGTRPEVRDSASDEMLALLGFKPWNGYGYTDDPDAPFITPGSENIGRIGE